MKTQPFKGRVVLITGASGGIGRAAAKRYAEAGADVVLAARRLPRVEDAAREVASLGVRALPVRCDVTVGEDVERLMRETEAAFGGLDVLVNNAGQGLYGPLEAISEAQLRQVFELNVFGLWRVTRAAMPLLRRRPGAQVVNVSSVLGHRGLPLLGGYCASKAAVNAMTESLRAELAAEGIRVLLVSPGLTESEFRENRLHAEGWRQEAIPLKAMSAEDVATAMVRASLRGRRDTVLTLPGRVMVLANRLVPGLFDRIARRMAAPPKKKDA
ncbi:SDR family oxidoreductase [Myxococcus sp. RHSTA-1-4]|uniref:SDR family oxidoreductase n=1 Tax=Myxococcus sp. RHSTA-1-4 TaxID=2874601 RepID=UPI001CBBF778|nr:SDR family oxidoreductase [Myxococcus sp. RHSTA-1-4]MBZ4418201.1 SDR family oxidoreductase [Myxococcus sp. RHSTA-1-4]